MFAAQTFDVTPDILCAGKGLSSGAIPIGAMMARQDIGDAFVGPASADIQFAHGNTYSGHPLACAVGIAVIDEIIERDLCAKARDLGQYLVQKLEELRQYGVVREVRGCGVLRGVELVEDTTTNRPFPPDRKLGEALRRTAIRNGLIMRIDPDWFAVSPPLIAEHRDIDEMCDLIHKSLREAIQEVRR
jgi:putrescine aminotransferase